MKNQKGLSNMTAAEEFRKSNVCKFCNLVEGKYYPSIDVSEEEITGEYNHQLEFAMYINQRGNDSGKFMLDIEAKEEIESEDEIEINYCPICGRKLEKTNR